MNLTRAFSALLFSRDCFLKLKKGKVSFCLALLYGRFLIISTASTAPMMIMTTMTATIPSIRSFVVAKPVTGEVVGAGVAAAGPA